MEGLEACCATSKKPSSETKMMRCAGYQNRNFAYMSGRSWFFCLRHTKQSGAMMQARSSSLYLFVLAWTGAIGVHSFSIQGPASWVPHIENIFGTGGGRAAEQPDQLLTYDDNDHDDATQSCWEPKPCEESEARLIVLQITDVYTLENFAHFKTLLEETRAKAGGAKVVCMLTGDFLSPYLLSTVDKGAGMMNAVSKVPMDYLTWGNHEADIDHRTVCKHVRNFPGKWINSNMLDHEAMDCQQEYDVVEIGSPDGSNTRKVGLTAVLSDDPALYSHFKAPGAFGGATITDPWEALTKYQRILKEDEGCDMVLPLQHLYVPDDHRTCREFDFPVILSGHDHHRVDEVIEGTRLLKPGMNGDYATVLEISWPNEEAEKPKIRSRFVKCENYKADAAFDEENERAYDCLLPLRNTELARVPPNFEPLTSNGSRDSVCTMGKFICSLIKSSLNRSSSLNSSRKYQIDSVLLMGGNIRGNADYENGSFFSLEALEAEVKSDEAIGVVNMPGWLLAKGIEETHSGEPISGWMQYDEGVQEVIVDGKPKVTHVGGEPLDENEVYRVATKISDLTNGQSIALTEFYQTNKHLLPPKGSYININAELMGFFSYNLFRRLWSAISREMDENLCPIGDTECDAAERLAILDQNGNGEISVEDILVGLREKLGYETDKNEMSVAQFVHTLADQDGDGKVTLKDFKALSLEMEELNEDEATTNNHQPSRTEEKRDPLITNATNQNQQDEIEVHITEPTAPIQIDGKQRNFMREERISEVEQPSFPDLSQLLVTALMGEGSGSDSSSSTPQSDNLSP